MPISLGPGALNMRRFLLGSVLLLVLASSPSVNAGEWQVGGEPSPQTLAEQEKEKRKKHITIYLISTVAAAVAVAVVVTFIREIRQIIPRSRSYRDEFD